MTAEFIYKRLSQGLVIALLLLGLFHVVSQQRAARQLVELQNQVASQAKTIEEKQGLYEKLALQETSQKAMLDVSDAEVKELSHELSQAHQQLQSATQLTLKLKQQTGRATVTETSVPASPSSAGSQPASELKLHFIKDFGTVVVSGDVSCWPPWETDVTLAPGQPLKLTVAIAQDKTKAWHAYAASSDPNVSVDIGLTAVNPYVEAPKWYEKIGITGDLALGSTHAGAGVLAGLGATYQVGKLELGPKIFVDVTDHVDEYYGVGLLWHPFQRD